MNKAKETIFYYQLDDLNIPVILNYKKIKNKIFRYDAKRGCLKISCPSFVKEKELIKDLDNSKERIKKWLNTNRNKFTLKEDEIYLFGKKYLLVKSNSFEISDEVIFYDDMKSIILNLLKDNQYLIINIYDEEYFKMARDYPKPNLLFKQVKTYWGQYNKKYNKITLNIRLIHYPLEVIKYVIIHELTHIKEMSHNRKFYQLLSEANSNYKEAIKILKEKRYG